MPLFMHTCSHAHTLTHTHVCMYINPGSNTLCAQLGWVWFWRVEGECKIIQKFVRVCSSDDPDPEGQGFCQAGFSVDFTKVMTVTAKTYDIINTPLYPWHPKSTEPFSSQAECWSWLCRRKILVELCVFVCVFVCEDLSFECDPSLLMTIEAKHTRTHNHTHVHTRPSLRPTQPYCTEMCTFVYLSDDRKGTHTSLLFTDWSLTHTLHTLSYNPNFPTQL